MIARLQYGLCRVKSVSNTKALVHICTQSCIPVALSKFMVHAYVVGSSTYFATTPLPPRDQLPVTRHAPLSSHL